MIWYYAVGKDRKGPFNEEEFNNLVESGEIKSSSYVWNKTMDGWQKFGTIDYNQGPIAAAENKSRDQEELVKADVPASGNDTVFKNETKKYLVEFNGSSGEYFRIWVVNLFLTILSCGIYAAWAKVRTRKYFYVNTKLDGQSFDYLANPVAILKGNLLIAGAFILFNLTGQFMPAVSGIVMLLFYISIPLLVYKSLSFTARNTAYRNIRYCFTGGLWECYKVFLLIPVCIPFTLGLIFPYWYFRQKKYFFENFSFGSSNNEFHGSTGFFYKTLLIPLGVIIVVVIVFSMMKGVVGSALVGLQGDQSPTSMVTMMIFAYLLFIAAAVALNAYLYVRLNNYCFEHTLVGTARLKSSFEFTSYLLLRFTNVLAIIFSVGLLFPWAKVRKHRYLCEHFAVYSDVNLDDFSASQDGDVSAVGDSAADFFDLEIGL